MVAETSPALSLALSASLALSIYLGEKLPTPYWEPGPNYIKPRKIRQKQSEKNNSKL